MQLHLKTKEIARVGMLMALAVILIVLSGVIEASSMFLLAAAAFLAGIFQRRFKTRAGAAFVAGTFLAGLILAPQKLYCFTFAGFAVYVLVAEYLRGRKTSFVAGMFIKGLCYHILLVIALVMVKYFIGFEALFQEGWIDKLAGVPLLFVAAIIAAAEILWIGFDRGYIYFQDRYGDIFGRWLDA